DDDTCYGATRPDRDRGRVFSHVLHCALYVLRLGLFPTRFLCLVLCHKRRRKETDENGYPYESSESDSHSHVTSLDYWKFPGSFCCWSTDLRRAMIPNKFEIR